MTEPRHFEADPPQRRRRLRSVAWAGFGCSILTLLALATLGGCGYLLSRLVGRFTG